MKCIGMALVAAALAAPTGALAQSPSDFAARQPLATSGDRAFFRIVLPDSVYDGAGRPDLGDLRVYNGDGALVPFAFVPRPKPLSAATPRRSLPFFPLTVDTTRPEAGNLAINVRKDATGTTVDIRTRDGAPVSGSRVAGYLVDASSDDRPLTALLVSLPPEGNVNARLRVDASDDLDRWRTIVADAPVLSLEHEGRRLTRDRVEFAPLRARYLRITWLTPAPPEVTGVLGDIGDRLVEPPRRVRRVVGIPDGDSADAFTFDLLAALPVDRVTLELPDVNTVVPVRWEARTFAHDPWRDLGHSVVYRLRQDGAEVVSAEYPLDPVQRRYFRARIDPRAGGVGATPPTLAAGWYPQEVVFAARGSAPFELAYGSRSIAPGALSIATLVPGYVAGRPLPDNVGVATLATAPSATNRRAMREPLDMKRWTLWGSLALASLFLGYMGLRLARQARAGDDGAKPDA
jgi:hypothetical protein